MMWRRRNGGDGARRPRAAGGRIVVEVEKALDVRAPVGEVFAACPRVDRLPALVPHLREARPVALDRHHWVIDEPSGRSIEWDTVVTRFGANQVIAWETPPGSVVRHAGHVAFRPNTDGSTRVSVRLAYTLPPGPFGERMAALVTSASLDESLRRWRARLEGRETPGM